MAMPKVVTVPVGPFGEVLMISGNPALPDGIPPLYLFRTKLNGDEQTIRALTQEQAEGFLEGLAACLEHVRDAAQRQPEGQGRLL